mmetsp:Transcript_80955/g.229906  ORF Transcript_80955/g.229906 Transcript_80955/m.229906 type:complete len:82 (-) Transcript_80955:146-391(-)
MKWYDIYATTAAVAGLVMSCLLPLLGAMIDHTNKRKQVGSTCAPSCAAERYAPTHPPTTDCRPPTITTIATPTYRLENGPL